MLSRKVSFVFSVFIALVVGQITPSISYISQETFVDIGGHAQLECTVLYQQKYPVMWKKISGNKSSDAESISSDNILNVKSSRFSLKYHPTSSTYTLQISDIRQEDAGNYRCELQISPNNKIFADVNLFVRLAPNISSNFSHSVMATEGEQVTLVCYAHGFPTPRISWRRKNNVQLPTGGIIYRGNTLEIPAIRKDDAGTYICKAENAIGVGAIRNVLLTVEFRPVITVSKPWVAQALQHDMDLECRVRAYPPPTIVWTKGDNQVTNNCHYSVFLNATGDGDAVSTLRVKTIEKHHYGTYSCKAMNKKGYAEARVQLFEYETPVIKDETLEISEL